MGEDREKALARAKELVEADKSDEAIEVCNRLLAADADDAAALTWRAAAYSKKGEYKKAIADNDHVLEKNPDKFFAYYNRGTAKMRLGDHRSALADFEAYLKKDPNDDDAKRNRGVCLAELGEGEMEGGRMVAAPSKLSAVPAGIRVDETFGFGVPTFALTLVGGAIYAIGMFSSQNKPIEPGFYAGAAVAAVLGAIVLWRHIVGRGRPIAIAPTVAGIAIYRSGKLVATAKMSEITLYQHSAMKSLYFVVIFGVAMWGTFQLGQKEAGVFAIMIPILLMLASEIRNRFTLTTLYVLRGEGTTMFPKAAYQRSFGSTSHFGL